MKERKKEKNIMNKVGIFAGSLFVTAVAIYMYSPVLGSNAADAALVKVKVEVNPIV